MLLVAVLILLCGIGGCAVAAWRFTAARNLSPLFENSFAVAIAGLVLSVIAAAHETSREALRLAGWLMQP